MEINSSMDNYQNEKKSQDEDFFVEVFLTLFFIAIVAFTFFVIFRY